MTDLKSYVSMARPDHWFKNIFMLPGTAVALLETGYPLSNIVFSVIIGFFCACLVASANYVINEILDAEFDKNHPVKKDRPAVNQQISLKIAYSEYLGLLLTGISLGFTCVNPMFALALLLFAVCGALYNVRPFRLKDKTYIDVLFEAFNNVIRLLLGWFAVSMNLIPPFSLIFSFWTAGAFLMSVKRYAELREIGDRNLAALYRRSFKFYTEGKLMISSFFYAINFAFFFGVFLYKYRIEYILLYPVFSCIFAWYLHTAMRPHSVVQNPQKLFQDKILMMMISCTAIAFLALTYLDIPSLRILLRTNYYR